MNALWDSATNCRKGWCENIHRTIEKVRMEGDGAWGNDRAWVVNQQQAMNRREQRASIKREQGTQA